ncbi:12511_t:CDS:2 [Acaulospora morrowiae]|uniref:12511_t:CDS:1 n=1 Tax=Acaulospora morrowiae TaxID=94023 RepID=A0A9N9FGV2_9GLOM|nr:12511_t:CDS:2 [Acaulospora morrowiae]
MTYDLKANIRKPKTISCGHKLRLKCSSLNAESCRSFPSDEYGDCDEEGFCEEWNAAKIYMILASIIGGVVLMYLTYVIFFGGQAHREDAWKFITFGIGMLSFLQIATIFLIVHLYHTSDKFYYGVKFDDTIQYRNMRR